MKRFVWLSSVLLLVLSVSGCGCPAILNIRVHPSTVILPVGETAPPPQVSTQGCFKPWRSVEFVEWTSEDPEIASVDADTGVITGVAPGKTTIIAFAEENFRDTFPTHVTVVASTTAAR